MEIKYDLTTILLIGYIIGYIFTSWYQSSRIKNLEKSREDIKIISDQIKIYADLIKIDEIKKYLELAQSNLKAEHKEEIKDLKAGYEERIKELKEESEKLVSFRDKMFNINYYRLFEALTPESKKELLEKNPDINMIFYTTLK